MSITTITEPPGVLARAELEQLGDAIAAVQIVSSLPGSETDWERMAKAAQLVETAAARLYDRARSELRRFEACDRPGPEGCGCCDACREWGDEQHEWLAGAV